MQRIATVRTILAGALLTVVSTTALFVARPAYALSGLVHHSEMTEISPGEIKSLTVSCPRGKQVISGGAEITGRLYGVRIIGLEPDTENGGWFRADAALEEPGSPGEGSPWALIVFIICADPPPSGLHYDTVTTRPSRDVTQWVRPSCGEGQQLVGFGGRVATAAEPRNVALTAVLPDVDLKSVLVEGVELEAGEDRDWSVTAYTVCAEADDSLIAMASSTEPSSQPTDAESAGCNYPVTGTRLYAIGGVIYSGFGHVVMTKLAPSSDVAGQMHAAEDLNGTKKWWYIGTVVICGHLSP